MSAEVAPLHLHFQNSTRWGAVTKGVLVCGGMHRFCMSASPPSQLFTCVQPCGFGICAYMYWLGLVCYRGSPCSSFSSLNGTCRMHYLCGWLVIRASPLLCVVIRHIGTSRSLMLPHETPNFDHCFGPSRNLVPCRLTSALSTPS